MSKCRMWRKNHSPESEFFFKHRFLIGAKKFHAAKPLAFLLQFQNHYSNLTSKIIKMWEQILKKRERPNTIQIFWIVKKKLEKANNSPNYRCAAINKNNMTEKVSFQIEQKLSSIDFSPGLIKILLKMTKKSFLFFFPQCFKDTNSNLRVVYFMLSCKNWNVHLGA